MSVMAAPERIELLLLGRLPVASRGARAARGRARRAGVATAVELHEVHSQAEAEELRFPGSPTIRIDGRDVDPSGAGAPPSLTCRIYRLPDGRVSPVPSREQLEEALAMSLALGHRRPSSCWTGVDGREHTLDDYARRRAARPDPVVQPLPVRDRLGGPDDRRSGRLRLARRAARRVQLERRRALSATTRSSRWSIRAGERGFTFDYLHDPEQTLARALGSERTPEVFVFDRDRRLVYHGAIDDNRDETAGRAALPPRRARRDARRLSAPGGRRDRGRWAARVKWRFLTAESYSIPDATEPGSRTVPGADAILSA